MSLGKKMRTQNKENYYYVFWVVAMVAFIVPQVVTAIAYHKLADILTKPIEVEIVEPSKLKLGL
jgi:hypothetical protein